MDHDGIKFHSLFTTQQKAHFSVSPFRTPKTIHKIQMRTNFPIHFPTEEFSLLFRINIDKFSYIFFSFLFQLSDTTSAIHLNTSALPRYSIRFKPAQRIEENEKMILFFLRSSKRRRRYIELRKWKTINSLSAFGVKRRMGL